MTKNGRPVWGIFLAVVVATCAQLFRFQDESFAIDDAWISFRIARNWIAGDGLTFNAGEVPVEGMTNLLWTLLSGVWIWAEPNADPMVGARIVGALCLLTTVAVLLRLSVFSALRLGGHPGWAVVGSGSVIAASGSLAYHSVSGLETAIWGLLFVLGLYFGSKASNGSDRWLVVSGVAFGLLAATRPEGVLVGAIMCAAGLHFFGKSAWKGVGAFCLLVGSMQLFRLGYYGELVPNTFYAKPPNAGSGLEYGTDFVVYGLGGLGVWLFVAASRCLAPYRWLVVLCAILTGGAVWSGGDWMMGHRRFTLVLWSASLLAGMLMARKETRLSAVVGCLGCVVGPSVFAWSNPSAGQIDVDVLEGIAQQANDDGLASVALVDIGRFGWVFEGELFDMVGLTDRVIARQPGTVNEKKWDEQYFRSKSPDLLLVRSQTAIGDPLEQMPVIGHPDVNALRSVLDHGGYHWRAAESFGPNRHILVFARNDLALRNSVWGPTPEKDLRELLIEFRAR
jgi:arabinofuranosyltransferase